MSDVGGVPAIMVSTKGFSLAAERLLGAVNIAHLTITLVRAEALQWIPILEKQFAIDPEFKEVSGKLTEALRSGNPAAFDHEAIPYEEWLAVMYTGLSRFPTTTKLALHRIASNHPDGGHRYNAILLLSTENALDSPEWLELLSAETDPEVIELIQETLDFCEA